MQNAILKVVATVVCFTAFHSDGAAAGVNRRDFRRVTKSLNSV
jgi:hypothetical protein